MIKPNVRVNRAQVAAALALAKQSPMANRRAQWTLLFGALRRIKDDVQSAVKARAPVRTGLLRDSIKTRVAEPEFILQGRINLVPMSARHNFLGELDRKFEQELGKEMEKELASWIRRNVR